MFNPSSLSIEYLERLWQEYLRDASAVPPLWRQYFQDVNQGNGRQAATAVQPSSRRDTMPPLAVSPTASESEVHETEIARRQDCFGLLLRAYRERGHLVAHFNPLEPPNVNQAYPELTPEFYGLVQTDLDRPLPTTADGPQSVRTLRGLVDHLQRTYCRSVGAEFMALDDLDARDWLRQRMEATENTLDLSAEEKIKIFSRLTDAVVFEEFVQRKYVGAKSFSLEGAEILIPLLDLAIAKAAAQGIGEIVMGMAHRGRLNVLANILGKAPRQIFQEFEDKEPLFSRGGDVKYHLGHSNVWFSSDGTRVALTLCFNPSHLEFVDPVAEGVMRAKQDRGGDVEHRHGLAILIHGDAAFAGEGIVQETLNFSGLPAYTTGGTLHVIVNNQVGFTTPPSQGRSTRYASDVAKMLQSPIFHVNGEDPEAIAHVVNLALDFRQRYHRDVLLDVYCYRRRGHNESDEPAFTQPVLYRLIEQRKSVRETVLERLIQSGVLTRQQADQTTEAARVRLENEYTKAKQGDVSGPSCMLDDVWKGYQGGRELAEERVSTSVRREILSDLILKLTDVPDGFHVHPKLERWLQRRRTAATGEHPVDWSTAEAMALGTLAIDGYRIRLTGQDTQRGTFSQRHAVLHDVETGEPYMPLAHVAEDQAPVEIVNSPLSEAGVLGFEYGYSLDYPDCLVAWEAQFGDFWNAGQVIVDQFLASAEEKWSRLSGIVMLLPHGYEGQGPEHSSARLERFLNLATEHNLQVVVPTTPAQYFHCLRRQMLRRWLKPLVILTPKSLLRHPRVVSLLDEFTSGTFERVFPDFVVDGSGPVNRIVLCSGKVYYDLLERREQLGRKDLALIRLEQLYPFPQPELREVLDNYEDGTPVYWVQEEPENMGACHYIRGRFREELFDRYPLQTISRPPSASPAAGSATLHVREQQKVLARAFDYVHPPAPPKTAATT
jgi:2-oxoglutarate dehydrogenase E1 component